MADPNPFDLARSKKTITEEERKKKNLARMNAERAARAEAAAADAVSLGKSLLLKGLVSLMLQVEEGTQVVRRT